MEESVRPLVMCVRLLGAARGQAHAAVSSFNNSVSSPHARFLFFNFASLHLQEEKYLKVMHRFYDHWFHYSFYHIIP